MRLFALPLATLALAACAATPPGAAPGPLATTSWQADVVAGKNCSLPSTLEFIDGQRAAGSLGCNRFTAVYELNGTQLKFGPVASTRKMCAPELMSQETAFAKVLESTRSARRDGDALTLYGADNQALVKLTPEKPGACN
ncbi:MAG: META domain-containing protein [Burkholderiaceae bacterium]